MGGVALGTSPSCSAIVDPFRALQWTTRDGRGLCVSGSTLVRLATASGAALVYDDRSVATASAGACLPGQLTDLGRARMAALGARLRTLYGTRLDLTPSSVVVRSTEVPRAIESAHAVLQGLQLGAAVPIHVREERSEYLYPNARQCPALRALTDALRRTVRDAHKAEVAALRAALAAHLPTGSSASAHELYDALAAAHAHGLPLPPEADAALLDRLERLAAAHWWDPYTQNKRVVRLGMGRLLGEIVATCDARVAGAAGVPRLSLYSAHDSTIAPLLAALEIHDGRWPAFGAHVAVELLAAAATVTPHPGTAAVTATPGTYVRVLVNHTPVALPACAVAAAAAGVPPTLCPYAQFRAHTERFVPTDHATECQAVAAP
jgi:acid phosphatase